METLTMTVGSREWLLVVQRLALVDEPGLEVVAQVKRLVSLKDALVDFKGTVELSQQAS